MTVNECLNSKMFLSALKGAREGGWSPMAFAVGNKSNDNPNGVTLIQFQGKIRDHGDVLNAIRHGLADSKGKFKSAILLQESWVSTVDKNANPEAPFVRPRDDPKHTSAIMVTVYTINRAGKFVDVPELGKRYALVGEKRIMNTGIKMEDVRLHPERKRA